MAKKPIIWRVCPKPSGFAQHRAWPEAYANDGMGNMVAYLKAENGWPYRPSFDGQVPLIIIVKTPTSEPGHGGWRWSRIKTRAGNVAEAKTIIDKFYKQHEEQLRKLWFEGA